MNDLTEGLMEVAHERTLDKLSKLQAEYEELKRLHGETLIELHAMTEGWPTPWDIMEHIKSLPAYQEAKRANTV